MKKLFFTLVFICFLLTGFSQTGGIYIKFSDPAFKGEVTGSPNFSDYMPAYSIAYGQTLPVTMNTSGGQMISKPKFSDISFLRDGSLNSPTFAYYSANGKHIASAEIDFVKMVAGVETIIYKITLNNIIITSISTSATNDCNTCAFGQESIGFTYTKITWQDIKSGTSASYDISANAGL